MLRLLLALLKNHSNHSRDTQRPTSLSPSGFLREPRAVAAELPKDLVEVFPSDHTPHSSLRSSKGIPGSDPSSSESRALGEKNASGQKETTAGEEEEVLSKPEKGSKKKKMAVASHSSENMRRMAFELMMTLVGVAASSAALYFVMKKLDPNAAASRMAKQKKKEIARRLGRPMIQTNQYEDIIACDVINPENIEVTFDCIGGLTDVKQNLHELIILPLVRPELFTQGKLLRPQKGVLLYGPPGTGKTLLAKAVAKECGAAFINVRVSSLMSKWFGDAQKLVTAVFTLAHKLQPCIIFIDEIDSILGQRKNTEHEAITSMKTEFMSLWDGFCTDDNARVMVLCATNRPWDLDEAILRRLPRTFEIPLPDRAGRAGILEVILRDECPGPEVDYDKVAEACEGYSGSDLMELCKQAAYYPLRDLLEAEKELVRQKEGLGLETVGQAPLKRPLQTCDFLEALKSSPPAREAAEEYRRKWTGARDAVVAGSSSSSAPTGAELAQLLRVLLFAGSAGNGNVPNGNAHNGN